MSRFIGPYRQLGNVVHDVDAAIEYWTKSMGVGPFFVARKIRFDRFWYRDEPAPSPVVTLAFAQAGNIQIELIQQHDDTPSGYRDFLDSGHEGPQHLACWFGEPDAYDKAYQQLRDQGLWVRHRGDGLGARFAYFSRGDGVYPEVELAEALLPSQNGWFDFIAAKSVGWDGSNPVLHADGTPESGTAA